LGNDLLLVHNWLLLVTLLKEPTSIYNILNFFKYYNPLSLL
jgi:hypothetical protein